MGTRVCSGLHLLAGAATMWSAAGLATAEPAALAQRWQSFVDHARFEAVTASYDVLGAFDQAQGSLAERCAAVAIELGNARRTHPFSPLLARMGERCAADEPSRERAAAESTTLRDFLLAESAGQTAHKPVLVMTEADALALVEQLGGEPLYGRYQVLLPAGRVQFVATWLDPVKQQERKLHFDILQLWHLLKTAPGEERYPAFEQGLTQRFLQESVAAGNGPAELAAITTALARRELAATEAAQRIEALALSGLNAAALELLPLCLTLADNGRCAANALDLVRPLAERGLGDAMLVMALAASRGVGGAGGARQAGHWMKLAGKRLGRVEADVAYAGLWLGVGDRATIDRDLARRIRGAARSGNIQAMLLLSDLLRHRRLAPLRGETPNAWLLRAAEQGSSAARRRLGVAALKRGDLAQGWELIEAAAADDDRAALSLLASALENGQVGLDADPARALRLFRRAAELGGTAAMRRLARAWQDSSLGLQANAGRSEAWYLSAVMLGDRIAASELAELYLVATPGFEGKPGEGYALLQELVADGVPGAQVRQATALLLGQGVVADVAQAMAMLRGMEAEGISAASFRLGQVLEFGQGGVSRDLAQARAHYKRAAAAGYLDAMDYYARALYAGRGGDRDRASAVKWWGRAARQGHTPSIANLAWTRCSSGDAGLRDPVAGARLVTDAMQRGRSANLTDTLAACLAAAGQYEQAAATQREALALAVAEPHLGPEVRKAFAVRLALYQRGEAWRDPD